ncbi:MAG: sigma-70 family RNA polymerase sigma factor [Planctomycetes bacterium]|nr:sigma-70 family RNA polymerase sigma factor [Planctomycetota bacterium]
MPLSPITAALERADRGEPGATDALWQLVYADLKRIASSRIAALKPGQTLQATALVHEAWMRLQVGNPSWSSRAHFFGAAAQSMRNILVDQARRKHRLRRNAGQQAVSLEPDPGIAAEPGLDDVEILALDEALDALGREYERPTRIVMLRYFAGLSMAEIAELLGVTRRTVDRDFLFARTWLRRFLDRGAG